MLPRAVRALARSVNQLSSFMPSGYAAPSAVVTSRLRRPPNQVGFLASKLVTASRDVAGVGCLRHDGSLLLQRLPPDRCPHRVRVMVQPHQDMRSSRQAGLLQDQHDGQDQQHRSKRDQGIPHAVQLE